MYGRGKGVIAREPGGGSQRGNGKRRGGGGNFADGTKGKGDNCTRSQATTGHYRRLNTEHRTEQRQGRGGAECQQLK